MKTMMVSAMLSLVAVSGAMGKEPSLSCKGPNGASCTAQRVKRLEGVVKEASKGARAPLADVKTLSIESDGTLRCRQTGGKACTDQQMQMVREVAASLEMTVTSK